MKLFALALLTATLAAPAALADKTCGGTPRPKICNGSCYENFACKDGKWVHDPAEICMTCSNDKNNGMDKSQDKDQKEPKADTDEQD